MNTVTVEVVSNHAELLRMARCEFDVYLRDYFERGLDAADASGSSRSESHVAVTSYKGADSQRHERKAGQQQKREGRLSGAAYVHILTTSTNGHITLLHARAHTHSPGHE